MHALQHMISHLHLYHFSLQVDTSSRSHIPLKFDDVCMKNWTFIWLQPPRYRKRYYGFMNEAARDITYPWFCLMQIIDHKHKKMPIIDRRYSHWPFAMLSIISQIFLHWLILYKNIFNDIEKIKFRMIKKT